MSRLSQANKQWQKLLAYLASVNPSAEALDLSFVTDAQLGFPDAPVDPRYPDRKVHDESLEAVLKRLDITDPLELKAVRMSFGYWSATSREDWLQFTPEKELYTLQYPLERDD